MATAWIPIPEAARIIARALVGTRTDNFPRTIAHEACGRLSAAAREGSVPSEGWRDGAPQRAALTVEDWASHRIDFARSRLEPAEFTLRRVHPDRITGVVVDAGAVRKIAGEQSPRLGDEVELPDTSADAGATTSKKEMAVSAAISATWPTGLPSFLQAKDRNQKIIDWCKAEGVSTVSDRTIERVVKKLRETIVDDK